MKIFYYTNENALLAYIDLLGTSFLYEKNTETLQKQAERLYMSLLGIFSTEFQNSFGENMRDQFYVNIYADSIMIHPKVDADDIADKLVEFLLKLQQELIFGTTPESGPVSCVSLVDMYPYFAIRYESPEEWSILQSPFTTSSLCGGQGMIEMDKKIKGLPVGVYLSKNVWRYVSNELQKRCIKVKGEDLYFIKQDSKAIDFLFLFPSNMTLPYEGTSLEEILKSVFSNSLIHYKENKWRQWIDVHENKIFEISRI